MIPCLDGAEVSLDVNYIHQKNSSQLELICHIQVPFLRAEAYFSRPFFTSFACVVGDKKVAVFFVRRYYDQLKTYT